MAVLRVMEVASVTVPLPSQVAVVVLREAEGERRELHVPVSLADGTAMAHALGRVATPRPLTHELFATVLERLGVDLVAVQVVGRRGGTYLAELELIGGRGRETVSCRPSDGITLALRQPVPSPVLADERLITGDGDVEPEARTPSDGPEAEDEPAPESEPEPEDEPEPEPDGAPVDGPVAVDQPADEASATER